MQAAGVEVNVSLKLTQMGLDIDPALCERNVRQILVLARELNGFVRLDMEGSPYTQKTLDFFTQRLFTEYRGNVGIVLQSALRRTGDDVAAMIRLGARVRLCKGAYLERPDVAYPDKRIVDIEYTKLATRLMTTGNYPGIATHDEFIIWQVKQFATANNVARDRFEFQMLYGIRRDLQHELARDGYRLRIYIPFGTQWYPYLMRRLAERPANIVFILGNVIKEGMRRP